MRRSWIWIAAAVAFAGALSVNAEPVTPAVEDGKELPREHSIYVPYEKLWKVFEKKGRGVFLPYEEFMTLWQTAEARTPRTPEIKPPVDALITEVTFPSSMAAARTPLT